MKKAMKYAAGSLALIVVLLVSFRIEKLDAYQAGQDIKANDPTDYANELWKNKIPALAQDAPHIQSLIALLEKDKQKAFEDFGRKLGISSTWYFLTKGEGFIESVEEEFLWLEIGENNRIQLATAFIFGNAVRDASGAADIDDFINMTDFNHVSLALNKLVKNEVVRDLKNSAAPGMKVEFAGAFEISEDRADLNSIRIIPVSAMITNEP